MRSKTELVNKVMHEVLMDEVNQETILRNGEINLTTRQARKLVERTVEETKKHIAKRIVKTRKGLLEVLVENGFFGEDADVEELIFDALEDL